jgi:hypothetical protein
VVLVFGGVGSKCEPAIVPCPVDMGLMRRCSVGQSGPVAGLPRGSCSPIMRSVLP